MRALAVEPKVKNSTKLLQSYEPAEGDGSLLVEMRAVGVCGTDREIAAGDYGWAPVGSDYLVLGHESLGEVREAPAGSGFQKGDLVAGIVRRPDPEPCRHCAVGQWDMCTNGRYTERGIKERHGFCSERYRLEPEFAVKVDPSLGELGVLIEPASVLAKAWDQIERIGARALFEPKRVLVLGAGPIGLLAGLLARQRGLELHVVDRTDHGLKAELVKGLGGRLYAGIDHLGSLRGKFDIVLECSGAAPLILEALTIGGPDSIVCLAGVSGGVKKQPVDLAGLNRELVLENGVVFGTVNANRRHYELAEKALGQADRDWLARLITRRVRLEGWREALEAREGDVKTIIVP